MKRPSALTRAEGRSLLQRRLPMNFRSRQLTSTLEDLGDGIYLIDALYLRPGLAAIYLVIGETGVAVVESGTQYSLPQVLAALDRLGIAPSAVDYVIPTHVHLDHAGGAGAMMQAFGNANLIVHARGARHLIDPTRLWAGTAAVYGEAAAARLYGQLIPVEASRVIEAGEGLVLDLGNRSLRFFDTPGHARHHVCILDTLSRSLFTGDAFGLSYRQLDVNGRPSVLITTTPTQFDPEAMRSSIARLVQLKPAGLLMTHFGRVDGVERLADQLFRQLDAHVDIADRYCRAAPVERGRLIADDLEAFFRSEAGRLGWRLSDADFAEIVVPDLQLNAQGLAHWVQTRSIPA